MHIHPILFRDGVLINKHAFRGVIADENSPWQADVVRNWVGAGCDPAVKPPGAVRRATGERQRPAAALVCHQTARCAMRIGREGVEPRKACHNIIRALL